MQRDTKRRPRKAKRIGATRATIELSSSCPSPWPHGDATSEVKRSQACGLAPAFRLDAASSDIQFRGWQQEPQHQTAERTATKPATPGDDGRHRVEMTRKHDTPKTATHAAGGAAPTAAAESIQTIGARAARTAPCLPLALPALRSPPSLCQPLPAARLTRSTATAVTADAAAARGEIRSKAQAPPPPMQRAALHGAPGGQLQAFSAGGQILGLATRATHTHTHWHERTRTCTRRHSEVGRAGPDRPEISNIGLPQQHPNPIPERTFSGETPKAGLQTKSQERPFLSDPSRARPPARG